MNGFYRQVTEELRKHGFQKVLGGKGSHEKWVKGSIRLTVPFNCYSRHTANNVMKDAGIDCRF